MSDRVKHKSRTTERSSVRRGNKKRKKSKKHSTSSSDDCVVVNSQRNSCGKEKKRKSRRKKRRRSSSGDSSSSDSSVVRLKFGTKPKQLLGERPEFCKNRARRPLDSVSTASLRGRQSRGSRSGERSNDPLAGANLTVMERRVLGSLLEERAGKGTAKDRPASAKKQHKSRKRRRSSSRSSSTSASTNSQSSSISDSSSVSSSSSSDDSSERRRRRRKKKKKKAAKKMMKREEKKRREERRKLKRIIKEKSRAAPVEEIKHGIIKAPQQDRLLKDINVELAGRARAMAPMTREQWEKRQSVVRRVYDEETGRQRLIKGDGEVLEEIVSRDRHMAINKKSTKGDGEFFQSRLRVNK